MTDIEALTKTDLLVLRHISEGHNNTRALRRNTDLTRRQIEYRLFEKLPNRDLIETYQPDGRVEEIIDGQKRNFRAPKHGRITEEGEQVLAATETSEPTRNNEDTDLIAKINQVESELQELEAEIDELKSENKALKQNQRQLRRHVTDR